MYSSLDFFPLSLATNHTPRCTPQLQLIMVETLPPTSRFGGLSSRLDSPYNPGRGYEYPFSTADQSAASFDPGLAAAWLPSVAPTVAPYWEVYIDQQTP